MTEKKYNPTLGATGLLRLYATVLEEEGSYNPQGQSIFPGNTSLSQKEGIVLEALNKEWDVTEYELHLFLSLLNPGGKARTRALEKLLQATTKR